MTPVRLYVYFKLSQTEAAAWRPRWQRAATLACAGLPGLRLGLSERPGAQDGDAMTWMESYRADNPQLMADGELLVARAMAELQAERHREIFVDTFQAGAIKPPAPAASGN